MSNNSKTQDIKQQISAEVQAAKQSLKWVNASLKAEQLANTRDAIISGRVQMRRIDEALDVNPAAAVFGQSQVGKSYLVKNLLKNSRGVLDVITDSKDGTHNFILDLNPSGGGVESTSLITRFTKREHSTGNDEYPLPVRIFSPTDVTLTLVDSYFSDVEEHKFPERAAIEERISTLEQIYGCRAHAQDIIGEDDVYEMIDYISYGSFAKVTYFIDTLRKVRYMERVAQIISAMHPSQWKEAFSLLWNDKAEITEVFTHLIDLLGRLDYARYVGINHKPLLKVDGTILCVDRIKEFFGVEENENGQRIEKAREPEMEVWTGSNVLTVKKSEFTSIAAEVVLRLPQDEAAPKQFMETLDILDFPGARSRMDFKEHLISSKEACTMLLRGRVGYLFNKYSRNYLISTLLFCHHDEMSDVTSLSNLMRGWIERTIGATPQERLNYLMNTEIPPLFIVSTKFNKDLTRDKTKEPEGASEEILQSEARHRWVRRYTNVLSDLIRENKDNRWFSDWLPSKSFDNIYLLRDYGYSDGVFIGYEQSLTEQWPSEQMQEYQERLRLSFLDHEFVQQHFRNPQEAWQRAATPNQDGSEYIIENLIVASKHVLTLREQSFSRMVAENLVKLYKTLENFYHDDNSDKMLADALESAGRIELTLGILFGTKPYLFTELLSSMLVSEENLHGHILDVAQEIKSLEKTDMNILFALRERAKVDPGVNYADNVARMLSTYHLRSEQELAEYLNNFGFTITDVINPPTVQNLPQIVAEALENYWSKEYISVSNLERFTKDGMPLSSLEDLAENLRALYFDKLHITDRIIERIRPYVTTPARLANMAEMLADMVAEMFNKFINTFGTAYFSKELWEDVSETVTHNNFEVEVNPMDYNNMELDEEKLRRDMNVVFDVFENIDKILNSVPVESDKLAYFSNYHNFRTWTRNMKIGFLATCEIPKYDVNLNNELRAIILRNIFDSTPLHKLLEGDKEIMDKERAMRAAVID